jgi:hypothetical protein
LSVAIVVLTLVLLAVVIAVVSRPLLAERHPTDSPSGAHADEDTSEGTPGRDATGRRASRSTESDVARREELEAAREAKYREIRDAELDYRTGKLSIEDYEAVNGTLRAEAVEILDQLEELDEQELARGGEDRTALEGPADSSADSSTRVS